MRAREERGKPIAVIVRMLMGMICRVATVPAVARTKTLLKGICELVLVGNEALLTLDEQQSNNGGGSGKRFTSVKSGEAPIIVKALPTAKIAAYDSYSIFKKVNSFEAKEPSEKNARGYAIDKLTPWDLASKYYQDQANKLIEEGADRDDAKVKPLRESAALYRAKRRYIMPFVDLSTGEVIYVDFSKPQTKAVLAIIQKQEAKGKLNKIAFELEKSGSGRDTVVSLTPVIDIEDLTDEQQKHFAATDIEKVEVDFEGLTFVADEAQQITNLVQAGFDPKLIGLEAPTSTENPTEAF